MKIVVLDGYTVNPGDLSWEPLESQGGLTVYDRTVPAEVLARLGDAEVALTNKTVLDAATIATAPKLRYIGVLATGYNVVDLEAASARGIVVTNVPAYSTASTAQGTIALLLELTNHVGLHDQSVHAGDWQRSPDFCYWKRPLLELAGLTLGVVGWGRIGKAVAATARAMGMKIAATSRSHAGVLDPEVRFLPLNDLLEESDVIALHCALTEETKGAINAGSLARMKPSALLLNTARGGLIVEQDLADALNSGRIAGAGLDVLTMEPPDGSSPLLTAKNCIITPHLVWASGAARGRLLAQAAANVRAFVDGQPVNRVNG
ncbi:MAG TPA: D-2-hydroxyacid dehydrogenase [Granulicella sp.]